MSLFFNEYIQKVGRNFIWLAISHICGMLLSFGGGIYLARILEPDGFGKIGFAIAIIGIFMQIANMGSSVLGTRDVAHNTDPIHIQKVISFRIIQSILSFTFLVLFIILVPAFTAEIKLLLLLYGLSLLISTFDLKWFFQGIEKMQYITLLNVSGQFSYVILLFFFVASQQDLTLVPVIYVIAQFLIPVIIGVVILQIHLGLTGLRLNISSWKSTLTKAFPIGASMIIGELYYIIDIVVLKFMKGADQVGYYNSATKVAFILNSIAGIFASAVFPQLASSLKESIQSFHSKLIQTLKIALTISLLIGVIGTFSAKGLIIFLYGESYTKGIIALQILVWMSAIYWLSIVMLSALVVLNHQKAQFAIVTAGVASNLILNILLVPSFGLTGASIASVSGYAVILLMCYFTMIKLGALKSTFSFIRNP